MRIITKGEWPIFGSPPTIIKDRGTIEFDPYAQIQRIVLSTRPLTV
jgi:hypothetical protein